MLSWLMTGWESTLAIASRSRSRNDFVYRVEDDDPARGGTPLARVRERRREDPLDRAIEIGVVAHHERVLAAELEARLRKASCRSLVDRAAGGRGAGEAHEVDVRVLDERRTGLAAEPVHDVEDAGRDARLERELREERCRSGRVLGRLHHRGVPAEDRGECLPGDVRQRRVEAHDQRRHAERLTQRHDGAVRHARGRRAAVRAASFSRDEEPHLDRRIRLADRERLRLAGLLDHDRGRLVAAFAEEESELADDVSARDGGALGPRGLRRPCRRDRVGHVVGIRARDTAEHRLVGRPDLLEPRAGTCRQCLPVDEILDVRQGYQADQPPSTTTFEPVA